MINELRDHWPAIQEYPWDFLWIFATGFSLGVALPAAWRWLFPTATGVAKEGGALSGLWARLTLRAFRPSKIQAECIRALRFVDHQYLAPYQVHGALERAYPLSDVTHALEELAGQGWARTDYHMNPQTPGKIVVSYSLWGPGLEFARKKGFQTGI